MALLSQLATELPIKTQKLVTESKRIGLVIVDEIIGFCTVGAGNLAPVVPNAQIDAMVDKTVKLAKEFSRRKWPIIALVDTHDPNKPEHPYPPHCHSGSGEDELVPALKWLENDENAMIMRKDCINGFIGAIRADGSNIIADWIKVNKVQQLLVVGICTDICVLDFVITVLSARNHGILSPLEDVFVYSDACASFDLPDGHPQDLTHHLGLYVAASRGAVIVDEVQLLESIKDKFVDSKENGFH